MVAEIEKQITGSPIEVSERCGRDPVRYRVADPVRYRVANPQRVVLR